MTRFAMLGGAFRQLLALTHLKDGWNFGRGAAPSSVARTNAMAATLVASTAGAAKFEFFPEDDGGILTIAYRDDDSAEILARTDGTFEFAYEDHNGLSPAKNLASIRALEAELEQRGWQLQKSYDSYTRVISASERTVTHPWHFGRAVAGCQSSIPDALRKKGVRFVPMQSSTIPDVSGAPPQFSGASERRNLLLVTS